MVGWTDRALENEVNDLLCHPIGSAQVHAGDRDEAEHDGRGLGDLGAVGPLYALKLGPGGAQEGDGACGQRTAVLASVGRPPSVGASAKGLLSVGVGSRERRAVAGAAGGGVQRPVADLGRDPRAGVGRELAVVLSCGRLGERVGYGDPVRAPDERGVELVDLGGGVLERARKVRAVELGVRRRGGAPRGASLATLLCAFAVTGHGGAPALAGLPVPGVPATPAAVLAQGDPVGVVALALVGLVVAMLTLLASEGDSDANVSAGHCGSKSSKRRR